MDVKLMMMMMMNDDLLKTEGLLNRYFVVV